MRLIEYLFPCQCIICSKVGEHICPRCLKGLPHTLPICCVCKKLSNKGVTHSHCSNLNITYFTGWYLSEKMNKIFDEKVQKGIWSIYLTLLTILITYLRIGNLVKECRIYPLPSNSINTFKLNMSLSKSLKGGEDNKNILLVGERLENIQEVEDVIKGLAISPLNIYILCLFVTN